MRNPKAKVSDPNKFVSCPGSDEHILYHGRINQVGEVVLVKDGVESISEKINAQAKFCDMAYIRSRLMQGDTSVMRDGSFYADLTLMPKTLAESLQLRLDAEHAFYELPLEVRNKFNNNFNLWLMESGTADWNEKMNIVPDQPAVEPIEEGEIKE